MHLRQFFNILLVWEKYCQCFHYEYLDLIRVLDFKLVEGPYACENEIRMNFRVLHGKSLRFKSPKCHSCFFNSLVIATVPEVNRVISVFITLFDRENLFFFSDNS